MMRQPRQNTALSAHNSFALLYPTLPFIKKDCYLFLSAENDSCCSHRYENRSIQMNIWFRRDDKNLKDYVQIFIILKYVFIEFDLEL